MAFKDERSCALCHKIGETSAEGRLLPVDMDTWVHVLCAIWSAECYETVDGGLVNVIKAIHRGKVIVINCL